MSMVAIIPVANIQSANETLKVAGFGPDNFSVAAYTGQQNTFGTLHSWDDPVFEAAVMAIPSVTVERSSGDPITRTQAMINGKGAVWGANAPQLPSSGTVTKNAMYRSGDGLWSVIQTFNRTTYPADPSTYPSLIREVHEPGKVKPWKQPIDQYDAYKQVNPFNNQPDQCTYNGQTWVVTGADGSGNNVWKPGVFGWGVVKA